jgi:hypothetical protein
MMLISLLFVTMCSAAPPVLHEPDLTGETEVEIEIDAAPAVWFARLVGDYSFGPNGTLLDVETDTDLHDSEVVFTGALSFRRDDWTLRILGEHFSTSGIGNLAHSARVASVELPRGASWASRFETYSAAAELEYAFWQPYQSTDSADLRLSARGGVVFQHIEQTFDATDFGLSADGEANVVALALGLSLAVEFDTTELIPGIDAVSIDAGFIAGPIIAGGSGYLGSLQANLRAHFTPQAALTFGFRLQGTDVTAETYHQRGSLMGVLAGVTFEF